MSPESKQALRLFRALPWSERLFVRARLSSAPLEQLARLAPAGAVADVGCGHGLLTALLALRPDRRVIGVDPDERKIRWAKLALGALPNVELLPSRIDELSPRLDASLDAVVVADVLYLLPPAGWPRFLDSVRRLLRPRGKLLLKEAEADGSWKYWKCLWQEELMVRLLRRTRSSGGLGFQPRAHTESLLARAGFRLEEARDLSAGYATPHLLFVAERR